MSGCIKRYFNKDVSDLTLSECAVIAAITKSPTKYNPITNPDNNASRRKDVLDNMLDQGYISQEEHDEALADNVYDRIQIVDNSTSSTANVNSYFVDTLTDQVMDDLINELGYTETQAFNALYGGGLTIYSTQNANLQQICDEEVNNLDNYNGQVEYSFSYRLSIQKADGTLQNYSEQTMLTYYREKPVITATTSTSVPKKMPRLPLTSIKQILWKRRYHPGQRRIRYLYDSATGFPYADGSGYR